MTWKWIVVPPGLKTKYVAFPNFCFSACPSGGAAAAEEPGVNLTAYNHNGRWMKQAPSSLVVELCSQPNLLTAQNVSILELLENIKTFMAGLYFSPQGPMKHFMHLFYWLCTWAVSKYGDFPRISSKHVDVPLDPLQSGDLVHEAIVPYGNGGRSISSENVLWCGTVSGVPFPSPLQQFWQLLLNLTLFKLREPRNGPQN